MTLRDQALFTHTFLKEEKCSYTFTVILHKQMLASERNETLDFHDMWKCLQNTLPEGT